MSITIRDVAERTGVDRSTVSRALNGKGRMSQATRERIKRVACELGYRPNMLAKGLATQKTGNIGVAIDKRHLPIGSSFYGVILEAAEAAASQHGYHIIFSVLRDHSPPQWVLERRVDGLLLLGTDIGEELVLPLQREVPVVLVDNHLAGVDSVLGDNVGGARLAVEHLITHGHKRIAFVAETLVDLSFRERFEGYRQALTAQGIPFDECLVAEGGRRPDSDRIAMAKLLESQPWPTAIFGANDYMAIGAMTVVKAAGLRVPEDMAVIGFDDGDKAPIVEPPLTTVHVPRDRMGEVATQRLMARLADPGLPLAKIVLPTELAIRTSCGCRP
jgi:LacI family transcriptional regulator